MALRELNLFVDLDQGKLVSGFRSTSQANLQRFVLGDSIPVSVRALRPNPNGSALPWQEAELAGQSVRIAIGTPGGQPKSGTFTLSFGANVTASVPHNATAEQLQTALNALASITTAGGVTVSRSTSGIYRIAFLLVGNQGAITANTAPLYPSIDAGVFVALNGDAVTREVITLRLETQPAAYTEMVATLPVAASQIAVIRVGSAGVSTIQSLEFLPEPYDGSYTINVGLSKTSAITFDASPLEIQTALELLPSVGLGKVTVLGLFPRYTIEFNASLLSVAAITTDLAGLVVPKGRAGAINTNTSGIIELLDGAAQVSAKIEIEIFDTVNGTAWTVIQADCTIVDDVIGNTPASTTGGPVYVTNTMVLPSVLSALGILSYASLYDANGALAVGQPYYDTTLLKLQITTS